MVKPRKNFSIAFVGGEKLPHLHMILNRVFHSFFGGWDRTGFDLGTPTVRVGEERGVRHSFYDLVKTVINFPLQPQCEKYTMVQNSVFFFRKKSKQKKNDV